MDVISIGDRVSWKRTYDDQRMFGYIMRAGHGDYLAKAVPSGLIFHVRRRDLTKECP